MHSTTIKQGSVTQAEKDVLRYSKSKGQYKCKLCMEEGKSEVMDGVGGVGWVWVLEPEFLIQSF